MFKLAIQAVIVLGILYVFTIHSACYLKYTQKNQYVFLSNNFNQPDQTPMFLFNVPVYAASKFPEKANLILQNFKEILNNTPPNIVRVCLSLSIPLQALLLLYILTIII